MHRVALVCVLTVTGWLSASDWPQFRGPSGQGISEDSGLPLRWNTKTGENVVWSAPLPKSDNSPSSPIVWRDRVFAMTAAAKPLEQHVTCFQKSDGKQLWDVVVPPGPWILTDMRGGYCCATPATDGERVYVVFGSALIAALDFDGKTVWSKELNPRAFDVAISSSPVIYKDTVILLCDQRDKQSYLLAYDRKTGEERWRQKRPTQFFNHSTPLIVTVGGKPQMIIAAFSELQGVDPENGEVLWKCAARGDVPTPAFGSGLVYSDDGRGMPGVCVDASGSGDVTKTHVKWTQKAATNGFNSPLIVGEYLYRVSSNLRCYKLATGEEVWSQRLGGDFNPSPFATPDGRIYYASSGHSWVIKAGPKYELLGEGELEDLSSCTPAVSDGKIIFKGQRKMYCVGNK
ncbi:MAG TPA: PQQ-binding-like beta-propeller repeat protein [Planctomycetota bacterium]|jgi:outer membrane protein assembly factor BamB